MMMKNTLILWMVVWSTMCAGGEYKILSTHDGFAERRKPSHGFATLQMFFKKRDGNYVPAAYILDGQRKIALNNITGDGYKNYLNKNAFMQASDAFPCNKDGVFVVNGEENALHAYEFCCEGTQGNRENFYVKYLHHTGTTEKLLDMPKCFVTLGSDSVELSFDNKEGHSNRNQIFPYQTIIDPEQVKAIRECIKLGHIFVINAQSNANVSKAPASYKVLEYKNNAYIHWNGWLPQFLRKCVERLKGFDKAEDVKPEQEIELDLKKNHEQMTGYTRAKNFRELFYMVSALYAVLKVYDLLK